MFRLWFIVLLLGKVSNTYSQSLDTIQPISDIIIDTLESEKHTQVNVLYYNLKGRTASGKKTATIKEPFVAISRDILPVYPLHSYIELSDCIWAGRYRVMDVMGAEHQNTVDVYAKPKRRLNKQKCTCQKSKS